MTMLLENYFTPLFEIKMSGIVPDFIKANLLFCNVKMHFSIKIKILIICFCRLILIGPRQKSSTSIYLLGTLFCLHNVLIFNNKYSDLKKTHFDLFEVQYMFA